jgi:hypothetical protein
VACICTAWAGHQSCGHTTSTKAAESAVGCGGNESTPFRVPAVYLSWANSLFLAFPAFSRINKLRRVNPAPNSDSPRRHHWFLQVAAIQQVHQSRPVAPGLQKVAGLLARRVCPCTPHSHQEADARKHRPSPECCYGPVAVRIALVITSLLG